jgi:hypothetical protein
LDQAGKFKNSLLKILGLKKDSEENQGSIFDLKKDFDYSDLLKIIKELAFDKEKL